MVANHKTLGAVGVAPATATRAVRAGPRLLFGLWRNPLGFLADLAGAQGDLAHVKLGWVDLFLLNHPDLVQELLVARHASFCKNRPLKKTKPLLGRGLLTSEGDFHRQQRRLILPAFHRQRIAAYVEIMAHYAEQTQARWRDGSVIDVTAEMMRLSQRVVAKSLFDTDVEDRQARRAGRALEELVRGFGLLLMPFSDLLLRLPLPASIRLRRARATLDALIFRMIEERRTSGDRGDVLSMLLFAEDEEGGNMDVGQVRDEVMTLFLAGHDTTGNSLAWTWYLLSSNPEAERRWHRELGDVLGGRRPTAEDVGRLRYTRQVFSESMRLYPPVPAVGRKAFEEVEIGGRRIPRGSIVEVSQWLLHRDPRFFPQPERFSPERFSPELEQRLPKGAYLPFGLGPRQCIGLQFAWMSGIVMLAALGQRWRLRAAPGPPVELLPRSITLRPKHGLAMRLERR